MAHGLDSYDLLYLDVCHAQHVPLLPPAIVFDSQTLPCGLVVHSNLQPIDAGRRIGGHG